MFFYETKDFHPCCPQTAKGNGGYLFLMPPNTRGMNNAVTPCSWETVTNQTKLKYALLQRLGRCNSTVPIA